MSGEPGTERLLSRSSSARGSAGRRLQRDGGEEPLDCVDSGIACHHYAAGIDPLAPQIVGIRGDRRKKCRLATAVISLRFISSGQGA